MKIINLKNENKDNLLFIILFFFLINFTFFVIVNLSVLLNLTHFLGDYYNNIYEVIEYDIEIIDKNLERDVFTEISLSKLIADNTYFFKVISYQIIKYSPFYSGVVINLICFFLIYYTFIHNLLLLKIKNINIVLCLLLFSLPSFSYWTSYFHKSSLTALSINLICSYLIYIYYYKKRIPNLFHIFGIIVLFFIKFNYFILFFFIFVNIFSMSFFKNTKFMLVLFIIFNFLFLIFVYSFFYYYQILVPIENGNYILNLGEKHDYEILWQYCSQNISLINNFKCAIIAETKNYYDITQNPSIFKDWFAGGTSNRNYSMPTNLSEFITKIYYYIYVSYFGPLFNELQRGLMFLYLYIEKIILFIILGLFIFINRISFKNIFHLSILLYFYFFILVAYTFISMHNLGSSNRYKTEIFMILIFIFCSVSKGKILKK